MEFRYSDSHRTKKDHRNIRLTLLSESTIGLVTFDLKQSDSYLLKSAATVPDVVGIPFIPENLTIAGLPAIACVPGVVDAAVVVFFAVAGVPGIASAPAVTRHSCFCYRLCYGQRFC